MILSLIFIVVSFASCIINSEKETLNDGEEYTIDVSEISAYTVIRADKASLNVKTAAKRLGDYLSECFGTTVSVKDDWVKDKSELPEYAKEIIVGQTTRPESEAFSAMLGEKDYGIFAQNYRIYILGGTEDALLDAIEYFKEKYVDIPSATITVTNGVSDIVKYQFVVEGLMINGVDISEYTVVIPDEATLSEKYAAANLVSAINEKSGTKLLMSTDASAETKYEILIGNTNRAESNVNIATSCDKGEYVLYTKNDKIVCLGESYMVGGGVGELVSKIPNDVAEGVNITDIDTEATVKEFEMKDPKSVILMIGDGMGYNTVKMSLKQIGEFVANDLPNKGDVYTGSTSTASNPSTATDSAASATALATGYKTRNNFVGMDPGYNNLKNIRELADEKGAMTGVITTDKITGATPSGFIAHHNNRNDTYELQSQINAVVNSGKIDYCMGDVDNSLRTRTAEALNKLSKNNSPFFIMIEEGQIDKRSHSNLMDECIDMVERFNDDIAYVIQFVLCHTDTVLIITADHETGSIKESNDGSFYYTSVDHSTKNVPIYALGKGTEYFNGKTVDNTEIAKFMAKVFGEEHFGK